MARGLSESKRRFLADESNSWVERGIITSDQRDGIMSCYVTAKNFPAVILTLGAAMIGIGVLSVIAANWRYMPSLAKIIIIVGAYAGAVVAAYFCEKKERLIASDTLMFLSGFLLLGGLALLSQIFHIEGTKDGLLLTWLVVYAPTFLLIRNISIFVLFEIVAGAYLVLNYFESNRFFLYTLDEPSRIMLGPWQPFLVMLAIVAVAWREWYREREALPSKTDSKLRSFFVGGSTRRILLSNFLIIIWFSSFCAINSMNLALLTYVMGVIAIGTVIQVIARRLNATDLDWQALVILSLCGLALSFGFVWSENHRFGRFSHDFTFETVVSSAALAAYLVWRILSRHKGSGWATVFFCLLLARWYFDMFFDFMDKGMFFLLGGILLMAIGAGFLKLNKHRSLLNNRGETDEKPRIF